MPRFSVVYSTSFSAGHRLEDHPGKCRRLHGHNYLVKVWVEGGLDEKNMVIDYYELKSIVDSIVEELDHHVLNEVLGDRNPTSELIARWIAERVSAELVKTGRGVRVSRVEVCETNDFCASYEP